MSNLIHKNEKGIVLATGLMFMAIIAIVGTTAVIVTTTDFKIGSNYRENVQAFYIAEAGLARAKAELINDLKNDQVLSNTNFEAISGTITIAPDSTDFYTPPGFGNISFGAGDYTIQFKNYAPDPAFPDDFDPTTIWVKSIGTGPNSSTATLESYLSAENISPWNNAIFAGGSGGTVPITGNVIIAGSIHILGDGLPAATTVFSNQTGDCRNNSTTVPPAQGMHATLVSKVDGGDSPDLNAKFRIKNGLVDMSGSADIGSMTSPFKGIYVTDGDDADGDGVNDDITLDGGASIFADEGATSAKAYDLGDYDTTRPSIDTALLDANCLDLTGVTDSTGDVQFNTNDEPSIVGTGDDKGLINGALELRDTFKVTGKNYYPDIEKYDGADWASSTNGIRFNSLTNILEIKGVVKVSSLNINITANPNRLNYTCPDGKGGTIYTTGATLIDGNVLPTAAASYPTTNVFGVISAGDITLGNGRSKLLLTGAYYTDGTAYSGKQTELAGTIVCKNFDITNQVPKIWQVPSLATNLPPGIPGSDPVWVFTDRTWREITE